MSCIAGFKNYVAVSGIFDRVSDEPMVYPTKREDQRISKAHDPAFHISG